MHYDLAVLLDHLIDATVLSHHLEKATSEVGLKDTLRKKAP